MAEIQAYLAAGGRIRRFEDGASANPTVILGWLNEQGTPARYVGHGFALVGRRKVNLAGLYDLANAMRRAKGLEPFQIGPSNIKAHFCFNGAPRPRRVQP